MAEKNAPMTEEEATLVELLSSSKRRRFVLNYVDNGGNATKAAVSAGYAEKSAHVEGSRLLKDDKVRAAIRKYSQAKANVAGENRDTILDRMINRAQLDIREYYVTVPIVDTEGNQRIARDGLPLVTEEMKQQGPELEFHCPAQADRDLANLLGYAKEDHSSLTAEDAAALIAASLAKMDELDHSSTAH
jgi:hypothetical protein